MFAMAVGVGASLLAGSAEMSFLGPYLSQSPIWAIFQIFSTWGEEGFISGAILAFTNMPAVLEAFVNALLFNYAVLGQDTLGLLIRVVLISCVSLPVLLGFFIEVAPRFLPWGKS